jgi:tetratricopeptide (TPR) repeat protein
MVEIGRELGVTYLLEGSFQKYGNEIRLIVQLIQTGKEGHVWANQYDRKWNDILSVQSEVAQAIAGELDVVITPKEKQLIEKTPTYNLSAYDAYLQGEFYFKKFTQDDLMTAMKYFELAKERDSLYALAYAGIFKVWGGLQQMGYVAPAEAGPKAIKAALKSLLLDSTLAEVHYTLGIMETYVEWNWMAAEASFKKGIELNPNYAEARAYYSHLLNILGRSEEAMKQIEIALSLDPLNPFIKVFYGIDLIFVHKYEEAIAVFQNALKIQPNYLLAIQNMAIVLHLAGKYKESFEQFKLSYNSYPDVVIALDQGNAQGGYQQGFISANRVLEERFKSGYWNPTDIAGNYALAGDNDKAIEWLETAYTIHDPNLIYLLMPHYDNLRNYPRFQALCLKMNLPIK